MLAEEVGRRVVEPAGDGGQLEPGALGQALKQLEDSCAHQHRIGQGNVDQDARLEEAQLRPRPRLDVCSPQALRQVGWIGQAALEGPVGASLPSAPTTSKPHAWARCCKQRQRARQSQPPGSSAQPRTSASSCADGRCSVLTNANTLNTGSLVRRSAGGGAGAAFGGERSSAGAGSSARTSSGIWKDLAPSATRRREGADEKPAFEERGFGIREIPIEDEAADLAPSGSRTQEGSVLGCGQGRELGAQILRV